MTLVKEKIEQALGVLNELNIDMWLTYVRKTSEIMDPSLYFLTDKDWFTWQTALILTKTGKKIAIAGRYDVPNVEDIGVYDEVMSFDESIKEPLLKVLNEHKPKQIAINYSLDNVAADGLTHGMYLRLVRMLEGTPFVSRLISSEDVLAAVRGRKTKIEVERIKKAIIISQEGHQRIRDSVKLGMTETEIAKILTDHVAEHNVTFSYPPLINVGSKTTVGHGGPSSEISVKRGDFINIDYGVFVEGYASDIQRLSYVLEENETEPPKDVKQAFETCVKAISAGAEALKPGVCGHEVDSAARAVITDAGYPEFMHALGHQIGRNVHDGGCLLGPKWEKYGTQPDFKVEEGQVFTLELHILVDGRGFCSIEDDVIVTKDGCEFLSDRQTELYLIKL